MVVSRGPVASTGPTSKSPASIQALRDKLEKISNDLARLQANRNPQQFQLHQLTNTKPLSQVLDEQFVRFDVTKGQYVPSYVDVVRNDYGNSFIEIVGTTITIQGGGCGPIIINGPGVQINTGTVFDFTATFNDPATFNAQVQLDTAIVSAPFLPTSPSGLGTGRLWRSGTTVMVV